MQGRTRHERREEGGGGHGCQLHVGFTETLGRVAGMVRLPLGAPASGSLRASARSQSKFCSLQS